MKEKPVDECDLPARRQARDEPSVGAHPRPPTNGLLVHGVGRFSHGQLLLSLVVLFAVIPFFNERRWGEAVFTGLLLAVMSAALLAIGGTRRVLVGGLVLALPAIVLRLLPHFTAQQHDNAPALVCRSLFIAYCIWQLLRFVQRSAQVNGEVLSAAISIYLLIGLLWSTLYLLDETLRPGSFLFAANVSHVGRLGFSDSFYFSFCALTTANYGDILPRSQIARQLSIMESVTGVLYLAVMISRLVSLYSRNPPEPTSS